MSNFIQFAEGILVHSENFLKRFEREPQPSYNAPVEAGPETTPEAPQTDTPTQEAAPVDPSPEAVAPADDAAKAEDEAKDETKE